MTHFHAVAHIDHHNAQVLQFDADHVETQKVHEHVHYTRQHGSTVRSEHEFFSEVCDALAGVSQVLIAGSHTAQSDFRRFVEKHRVAISKRIVGWEIVDHPTEAQLLALARHCFTKHESMAGTVTPNRAATERRPQPVIWARPGLLRVDVC